MNTKAKVRCIYRFSREVAEGKQIEKEMPCKYLNRYFPIHDYIRNGGSIEKYCRDKKIEFSATISNLAKIAFVLGWQSVSQPEMNADAREIFFEIIDNQTLKEKHLHRFPYSFRESWNA